MLETVGSIPTPLTHGSCVLMRDSGRKRKGQCDETRLPRRSKERSHFTFMVYLNVFGAPGSVPLPRNGKRASSEREADPKEGE